MRIDAAAAGLTPDVFWSLTPWEIGLHLRGYHKRLAHTRLLLSENAAYGVLGTGNKGARRFASKIIQMAKKASEKL